MSTANEIGDPAAEYDRRLIERQRTSARCGEADRRFSQGRGAVFLAALALVVIIWNTSVSPWWLVLPLAGFVVLVILHGKAIRQLLLARRAVNYYTTAQRRIKDRWMDDGVTGERYQDPNHPYAGDLDLFGTGSLFQLICQARTRLGEDTLALWLKGPADGETIRRRQQALDELRGLVDLREQLALLDAKVHEDLDQNQLLDWANEPAHPVSGGRRIAAVGISVLAVAGLVGWLLGLRVSFAMVPLLLLLGFMGLLRKRFGGCLTRWTPPALGWRFCRKCWA